MGSAEKMGDPGNEVEMDVLDMNWSWSTDAEERLKTNSHKAFAVRQAGALLNNSIDVIPVHFWSEILEKQRHGARWNTAVLETSNRLENGNAWEKITVHWIG